MALTADRVAEITDSNSYAFSIYHLSLLTFLWGIWLILPFGTFTNVASYEALAKLGSEFAFGVIAAGIAIAKIHFLILKKRISLALLCLMNGYLWILVGFSFFAANISNTGGLVYVMLGLYELWLYKRLNS
jgi:hypothetical protein